MRGLLRACAVAAAVVAAWFPATLRAQDAPQPADAVFQIREGVTPVDPGRPVPGARAAYAEDGEGPADLDATAVRADADGRLALPYRPGGATALVWAPGRAPVAVRVGAPVPWFLAMTPSLATQVTVRDATGRAVAGADVAAMSEIPILRAPEGVAPVHRVRLTGRTDASGVVSFDGLAAAPLSVTAHADGYVDASVYPVDPRTGVTIVLGRGSRVAGTLRLRPDGAPAKGARVALGPRTATVGDDGAFRIDTVAPGTWELRFEGAGFVPPPSQTLVVEDGRDRTGIDVAAWRTSSLVGKVVPAARPRVRLDVTYPPETGFAPTTHDVTPADDGSFRTDGLAPCDGAVIVATSPGCVEARVAGVSLPPGGESRPVEIALAQGGSVTGFVAGSDRVRLAGVEVSAAEGPPPLRREWARTSSGDDGSFRLDGLPEGRVWLRVTGRPTGTVTVLGEVSILAGRVSEAGELRFFAGYAVEGRVPGAPAGTRVVAERDGAEVARVPVEYEGFRIEGLSAGPLSLRAETDEDVGATETVSVPAGWPVTMRWDAAYDAQATIVDADGRPVAAASVRLTRLDGPGARAFDLRDPTGRVATRLARGRWRIEASDGAGSAGALEARIPDDLARGLVVTIERGANLRGTVVAAEDGHPLEGASVEAVSLGDDAAHARAVAAADGTFSMPGVRAGIVRFVVRTRDRGVHDLPARAVRPVDDVDLGRVEIARGTSFRVEVVGDGGVAAAGAEVRFECDAGTDLRVRTDAYGRALATGLPPGGAVLSVRDAQGALRRTQRIDVPWGWDERPLRIDLARGTRVRGEVTTGGRREAFARLTLRIFDPVPAEVTTVADAAGEFEFPPVAPGEGEIEVTVVGATDGWRERVRVEPSVFQRERILLPEDRVSGTVEAFDGGALLPGVRLELRWMSDPVPAASARSDGVGRFTFPGVAEGVYHLVATCDGYGPAWVQDVRVRDRGTPDGLRVVLPPEGRVTLRVRGEAGRGVSSAWVRAWMGSDFARPGPGPVVTAQAGADGLVVLRGLSRGPWSFAVGAPGRATISLGRVAVEEGDRDLGDVWIDRGGALELTTLGRGRLGGVLVEIRDVTGLDPRAPRRADDPLRGPDPAWVSGRDGRVIVPGLAPGLYHVWPSGRPDAEVRIRVRADDVVRAYLPVPLDPPPND